MIRGSQIRTCQNNQTWSRSIVSLQHCDIKYLAGSASTRFKTYTGCFCEQNNCWKLCCIMSLMQSHNYYKLDLLSPPLTCTRFKPSTYMLPVQRSNSNNCNSKLTSFSLALKFLFGKEENNSIASRHNCIFL